MFSRLNGKKLVKKNRKQKGSDLILGFLNKIILLQLHPNAEKTAFIKIGK